MHIKMEDVCDAGGVADCYLNVSRISRRVTPSSVNGEERKASLATVSHGSHSDITQFSRSRQRDTPSLSTQSRA